MAHLKSSVPSHAPLCMFVRCCGDCAYKRFLTTILGDRLCEAFSQESGERDLASLLTTLTLEPQCQSESSIPNWSAHSVSASTKWLARPSHDCNTIARDGGHEIPSGHRPDNQSLPPPPAKSKTSPAASRKSSGNAAHQACIARALGVPPRAARDCHRVQEFISLIAFVIPAGNRKAKAMTGQQRGASLVLKAGRPPHRKAH